MKFSGELKIIIGAAAFALIPVFALLGKNWSVYSLLLGRLFFAVVILWFLIKDKKELFKFSKKRFLFLVFWSLLMFIAMVTYFYSIHLIGMALSAPLLGLQPILIVILSVIFLNEKITLKTILAGILSVIGIGLISGVGNNFIQVSFIGIMLASASAFCLSFNFVYKKKYLSEIKGVRLVFYQSLFQIPFFIPFALYEPGKFEMNGLIAAFLLGLICTVISYVLIYDGIKTVAGQKIGVLQSVEYILPVLFGIIFFHEVITIGAAVGIAAILLAMLFITIEPSSRNRKIIMGK